LPKSRPSSRTKLKLGLETKPPEEQIAAAKAWLAERQGSAGTGRYLGRRRERPRARSAGLVALHVTPAFAAVDFAGLFARSERLLARRGGVDFPNLTSAMKHLKNIVMRHSAFDQEERLNPKVDAVAENADEDRQLRLERQRAARCSSALELISDLLPDLSGSVNAYIR